MPASELGPWGRIYFRIGVDKAHYSLEALGAFLKVWAAMGLVTPRGSLKLRAVVGLIGQPMVDFLVEEGDLIIDGSSVTMHRWDWYQAPLEQSKRRVAEHRERHRGETVDNVTERNGNVTVRATLRDVPPSHSPSEELPVNEDAESRARARETADADDPLVAFYEITNDFPNAPKLKRWIADVAGRGPHPRDFRVVFTTAWTESGFKVPEALKLAGDRLAAMSHRAEVVERSKPKSVDPLHEQIKAGIEAHYATGNGQAAPDATPEQIEAGRAAMAALRAQWGKESIRSAHRNGATTRIGDVLSSASGVPQGLSLTVDEGSDRKSTAVASSDVEIGNAPSPGGDAVRLNPEPNRANE